jgi:hypothetical protein
MEQVKTFQVLDVQVRQGRPLEVEPCGPRANGRGDDGGEVQPRRRNNRPQGQNRVN